jgi:hypothetical protein
VLVDEPKQPPVDVVLDVHDSVIGVTTDYETEEDEDNG